MKLKRLGNEKEIFLRINATLNLSEKTSFFSKIKRLKTHQNESALE